MKNYDLIPNPNELEILFVLESPHSTELEKGIPCTGDSGKIMTKVLLPGCQLAFGNALSSQCPGSNKFGIMESFNFPLGKVSVLSAEELPFSNLKNIEKYKYSSVRKQNFTNFLDELANHNNSPIILDYKERLINIVGKCPQLRIIVICGYIAQSVFISAFNRKSIPDYNIRTRLRTSSNREIELIFVNHPSPKNNEWDLKKSALQ